MDKVERAKRDVVIANRILAMEGVVDAYGHVLEHFRGDPNRDPNLDVYHDAD